MKKTILEYLGVLFGCFLSSVGFVLFINPYNLVPGGVFGTSIVLHNLFPSFLIGTYGLMISIPLLILSYFLLGKKIGARTLLASIATPIMMNALTELVYPNPEAIRSLDPSALLGGKLDFSSDLFLVCLIGPIIYGIGEGIMIRCKATSGGSDIVAMIIRKYFHVRFSHALMAVDTVVVCFGLVVIGFGVGMQQAGNNDVLLSFYSLICIVVASRTVSFIISGTKNHKLMFIITDHDKWEMRDFIIEKLDRTATVLMGHGLYSQQEKATLMMVVRMREVDEVTTAIRSIDPSAFVIVTDSYDAYGQRWKALPEEHSLQLN